MMSGSTSAFILAMIRAGRPACWCAISRRIMLRNRSRMPRGATISFRYPAGEANPVSTLKRSVRSAPSEGLALSRPKSVYNRDVLGL